MTNGPHRHTCVVCGSLFWCGILMECFFEAPYTVCDKPACVETWDSKEVSRET